ncbi:hypothetical protein CUC08_Gglean006532 [Alternaria sp. MG1]|nr:hypothetical protein CUC08_Gglean006532 [Alternaria sp. MG1]
MTVLLKPITDLSQRGQGLRCIWKAIKLRIISWKGFFGTNSNHPWPIYHHPADAWRSPKAYSASADRIVNTRASGMWRDPFSQKGVSGCGFGAGNTCAGRSDVGQQDSSVATEVT